MQDDNNLITFQATCNNCGRHFRVFHDKEKQYPKCMYCGGTLSIPDFVEDNITRKIEKFKSADSLYEFQKNCPICNRTIGTSGKIGEIRTCSYCTCNFKLLNTGALVPVSMGLSQICKPTNEDYASYELKLEQGKQILQTMEELIDEYSETDYAEILRLIVNATQKLITLNQFDDDFMNLVFKDLIPMLSFEISEEDNTYIFPMTPYHISEIFALIVNPSCIPLLRSDAEGFVLMTIPVSSANELRYIDPQQVSRIHIAQKNISVHSKDKTFVSIIEGVMLYSENVTKAQFFVKLDKEVEGDFLKLSYEGKKYFQTLFIDFGILFFLCKMVYGKWFPAYALRTLHPDALQRFYTRKVGEEISKKTLNILNRIIMNCQV